jgi:hypothetical protein
MRKGLMYVSLTNQSIRVQHLRVSASERVKNGAAPLALELEGVRKEIELDSPAFPAVNSSGRPGPEIHFFVQIAV